MSPNTVNPPRGEGDDRMHIKHIVLISTGFLFLGMGAVGVLIPVWPTTPFVLVSAACFSGYPKIREKIMRIGFFREYIESYKNQAGLRKKTVILSLVYLWGMLIISMILIRTFWIAVILALIGSAVTVHILFMASGKRKIP